MSDFSLFGRDLFGGVVEQRGGILARAFTLPPFTVLDARSGPWQDRKRAWVGLGIRGEVGRAGRGTWNAGGGDDDTSRKIRAADGESDGTSIFDPTLCELVYRWFSPLGGVVCDPFAGGSVRGVVASLLGRRYVGTELRAEQVDANREQAAGICSGVAHAPRWVCDDAHNLGSHVDGAVDLVFSCPPYADLERYSDDPRDLSTMPYPAFVTAYRRIIAEACAVLAEDRFAVFVVGDIRDARGAYRNFTGDTVAAFLDAGLTYYNEAILVTAVGSLSLRAGRQFAATRKLGKAHQNVLVFLKGDARRAVAACEAADAA